MWDEKYSKANAPIRIFLASRLMRLLPVFWLANIAATVGRIVIDPSFLSTPVHGWEWLQVMVANGAILGYSGILHSMGALNVAWSLDVELQFYLVFPFLIALLIRGRPAGFWTLFVAAICVLGLVRFLLPVDWEPRDLSDCGLYFLLGVMAARFDWKPSNLTATVLLWAAASAVAVCWFVPEWRCLLENEKHGATAIDYHHKHIAQAILALVTTPIAIFTVNRKSGSFDRSLGEFTYVVYLIHWPIMDLHAHYFADQSPLRRVPSLLAAWAAVAILSLLVFRYLDQPIERVRKRWVARQIPT
jgi:peptidoglycan/LPS O-acetylase OafA/YrhL